MPKFLYYRPSPFEKADTIPLLSSSKTAPLPLNLILTSANSGFFLKAFNTLNFLPHLSVRHRLGGDITPTRHGLGPSAHSKAGDTPKQTACKGRVSKLYVLGQSYAENSTQRRRSQPRPGRVCRTGPASGKESEPARGTGQWEQIYSNRTGRSRRRQRGCVPGLHGRSGYRGLGLGLSGHFPKVSPFGHLEILGRMWAPDCTSLGDSC